MLDRRSLLLAALSAPAFAARAQTAGVGPSSDTIRALLAQQIDIGRETVGYIAGVIDAGGTRLVTYGQSDAADARPLDGDTVFEIGSISKVFTALLLADMVASVRGFVDDPVAKYLPPQGRPQEYDGKPITLLDLATYYVPACRGCPTTSTRRTWPTRTPITASTSFTSSFRASRRVIIQAPTTSMPDLGFGTARPRAVAARRARLRGTGGQPHLRTARPRRYHHHPEPVAAGPARAGATMRISARPPIGTSPRSRARAPCDRPRTTCCGFSRPARAGGKRASTMRWPACSRCAGPRTSSGTYFATSGWSAFRPTTTTNWSSRTAAPGGYATFIGYSTHSRVGVVLLSNAINGSTPWLARHLLNAGYPAPKLHAQIAIDPAKLAAAYAGRYADYGRPSC